MPRQPIKQERAHETRARIIKGSASSFAENGYSGSTIADILQRSGVTKGALYFHFGTKEEVAQAVLEAHASWLRSTSESVRGRGVQGAVDLTALFCDALICDDVLRAATRLSVDRETFGLSQEPAFVQWQNLCIDVLGEARDRDLLLDGVDIEDIAQVAMSMLLGAHLASLVDDGGRSGIHAQMRKFWQLVLPGTAQPHVLASIDVTRVPLSAAAPAEQSSLDPAWRAGGIVPD